MPENTAEESFKAAWQALLRGDLAERDRLIARTRALQDAEIEASAAARLLEVDFYVNRSGQCIASAEALRRLTGRGIH